MSSPVSVFLLAILGLLSLALSAPVVKETPADALKTAIQSQIQEQEEELESLSSLNKEAQNKAGVAVENTKSYSYSNINGAVKEDKSAEEKVTDPWHERMISDIKEKLARQQASPEVKPETEFHASVDVPAAGIHKEIDDSDVDDDVEAELESNEEYRPILDESSEEERERQQLKDTMEFTPRLVAEYLVRTGETQEFRGLLEELVEAHDISEQQAGEYEKNVFDEVDSIIDEERLSEQDTYPESYDMGNKETEPFPLSNEMPEDVFSLYGVGRGSNMEPEDSMDAYINYLLNRPVSLDEMISTLLDEWLTRAIVTGDPEAEEVLSNIIDYVSRDDNPDDEGQVRAILGDIFSEAILEGLTPRIQPEFLPGSDLEEAGIETEPEIGESSESSQEAAQSPAAPETEVESSNQQPAEVSAETDEQTDAALKM